MPRKTLSDVQPFFDEFYVFHIPFSSDNAIARRQNIL